MTGLSNYTDKSHDCGCSCFPVHIYTLTFMLMLFSRTDVLIVKNGLVTESLFSSFYRGLFTKVLLSQWMSMILYL